MRSGWSSSRRFTVTYPGPSGRSCTASTVLQPCLEIQVRRFQAASAAGKNDGMYVTAHNIRAGDWMRLANVDVLAERVRLHPRSRSVTVASAEIRFTFPWHKQIDIVPQHEASRTPSLRARQAPSSWAELPGSVARWN